MLIKKGAEANIYLEQWMGMQVIRKSRQPKKYRVDALDSSLRETRTCHEARVIHDAKYAGVPTPTIYLVERSTSTIIMEFVDGSRMKEAIDKMHENELIEFGKKIGELIGRLHLAGIVHGDLTTSNIIIQNDGRIALIDFGLSEYSEELEKRGVDILLANRALKSTHFSHFRTLFNALMKGYESVIGRTAARRALIKMREIEARGRYSEREES
jgi:TP53 regulating kinase-like protein